MTALADEVRAFLADTPLDIPVDPLEARFAALVAFQRALHDAGLATVSWPEAYGGRGLGPAAAAEVARALGEAGAPELVNFVGTDVLAPALLAFVEPERLERWLPPMGRADEIWCQMFSEPDAGSDLANLGTRAVADGDGWRVTGQKVWSTWGQLATWGLLLARTGEPGSRHRGITAFVVPMDTPGIEIRELTTMTGEAEFAEVFLDDVRVGPEGLVGQVDGGWAVAMHILGAERGPYAVRRAAVLRASLGVVLDRARKEGAEGRARQLVLRAVTAMFLLDRRIDAVVELLAAGEVPGAEAALTKVGLTEAEQLIAQAWLALEGPDAMAWTGPVPAPVAAFLYSRGASIYGGTAQVQRNIIGERLLGLPRDP